MPYTALLLDLDHTLLDSDASEALAFEHALASAGIPAPARYLPFGRRDCTTPATGLVTRAVKRRVAGAAGPAARAVSPVAGGPL